jgi:integrase
MAATFPKTVGVKGIPGITATIYRQKRAKGRGKYTSYTLAYSLLGKLKRETFAALDKAIEAAQAAIRKIASGEQAVLELRARDRDIYQRASDILAPLGIALDAAAHECADVRKILNGMGTPMEAARYFAKHQSRELPRISVLDAVEKCLAHCRADGKSAARMHQLENYLNAFAEDISLDVSEVTPGIVSRYLTAMQVGERTKKNARDVIGYFGRWLVLHGYLERGSDFVEGVQRYSMKPGAIHIFTPAEMSRLIEKADARLRPYLVIAGFAGLRGAEIQRLDWSEVDLAEGFIEVKAEKAKTDTRRLVPIKPNLKAWLKDCQKQAGPVCPFKNVVNQLMELVAAINRALPEGTPEKERMQWKRNALRHSYISYRVAACADIARVADESGNSPAIIRSNYLRRVKPHLAKEWFNIMPAKVSRRRKIVQRKTAKVA